MGKKAERSNHIDGGQRQKQPDKGQYVFQSAQEKSQIGDNGKHQGDNLVFGQSRHGLRNGEHAAGEDKTRLTAFRFISNVAKIVIICIGALLVLELLGYSATRIFAALGIGGVAVAFACKDAVENLISGFIIVFNKPFRVGDFIAVGELSGTVEDIAVRSTTLRALDGSRYVLPNTALTNQSIINYADMEKRLINQTFTLHYKHSRTDLERFEQDLRALLQADPAVVQDDIRTDFVNYGAHGMDVQVYYYVIAPTVVELGQIKNRLNLQIKELLDKEGFELAYNSATVYLEQETEGKDQ